jgi:hypothetical protein
MTPSWISRNRTSVNQENAQHSTGPRTPSGKLRSSLNALTHGLTGRTVPLSSEDPADYQRHAQAFFNEYQPQGPTERQLVQELIDTSWRINRVPALEADVPPTWRRSATCEISHTRRGHKTLEAERRTKEERDLKRAAALLEMHKIKRDSLRPRQRWLRFFKRPDRSIQPMFDPLPAPTHPPQPTTQL